MRWRFLIDEFKCTHCIFICSRKPAADNYDSVSMAAQLQIMPAGYQYNLIIKQFAAVEKCKQRNSRANTSYDLFASDFCAQMEISKDECKCEKNAVCLRHHHHHQVSLVCLHCCVCTCTCVQLYKRCADEEERVEARVIVKKRWHETNKSVKAT